MFVCLLCYFVLIIGCCAFGFGCLFWLVLDLCLDVCFCFSGVPCLGQTVRVLFIVFACDLLAWFLYCIFLFTRCFIVLYICYHAAWFADTGCLIATGFVFGFRFVCLFILRFVALVMFYLVMFSLCCLECLCLRVFWFWFRMFICDCIVLCWLYLCLCLDICVCVC